MHYADIQSERRDFLEGGLQTLRKIRTVVTHRENSKKTQKVAWKMASELFITMETMLLCLAANRSEHVASLTKLLAFELQKAQKFQKYDPASIYNPHAARICMEIAYDMACLVNSNYPNAINQLLSRNDLPNLDKSLLLNPDTLVVAPLSTDRLMIGSIQRSLRRQGIPHFDLATTAISAETHEVVYPPNELKRLNLRKRSNVLVLCDAVANGVTAKAIHKDIRKRTTANIVGGK